MLRLLIELAWWIVPGDWVWMAADSLEYSIYESIRRAWIDLDRLGESRRRTRIEALRDKGTRC